MSEVKLLTFLFKLECLLMLSLKTFKQDLVTFVHQQVVTNERQSVLIEEQSEIISKQSVLIEELEEEIRVSLT